MRALYDVPAPAKLNLFLHIVGRRSDGYHLLQSAFMLIDWCDTLHFELRPGGELTREDLTVPLPPDDLVLRAARALQRSTGCPLGAHIAIAKSIPAQAGMGGGSSDAATTLLALNRLWKLNLSLAELLPLGLALGADVPFFLGGHNAWVEGIGEQLAPIVLPAAQFVVVKPAAGLETRQIFADPELVRDTKTATMQGFAAHAFDFGRNDLQAVAQKWCPDIGVALNWLTERGLEGRMTGSGSAVFAQLPDSVDPAAWSERNPAPDMCQVRVCGNLKVHPLWGWASEIGLSVGGL